MVASSVMTAPAAAQDLSSFVFGSSNILGSGGISQAIGSGAPGMIGQDYRPSFNEDPVGNRSNLRPGCEWDEASFWVQRCSVFSPAMGRDVIVQIQPSRFGGNAGLYLLDGLRAHPAFNGWAVQAGATRVFLRDNMNLVMPVGGEVSFYSDWNGPIGIRGVEYNYKWETFLTAELPVYLEAAFGISPTRNAIAGLSMSASSALVLAMYHPGMFQHASALSGYYQPSAPEMNVLIRIAMQDQCGCSPDNMWGPHGSERWLRHDPMVNAEKLRGLNLYVSSRSGIPGHYDRPGTLQEGVGLGIGVVLESLSRSQTSAFEARLAELNIPATFNYQPFGIHNWPYWNDDLAAAREQILNTMNGWSAN